MMNLGSSPHARGTPAREARVHYQHRFIPACAGNASAGWTGRCASSVHPRMRGERMAQQFDDTISYGSSPHARGTPFGVLRCVDGCQVHPRMRGERLTRSCDAWTLRGSSPHARGTLRCGLQQGRRSRFIPACAGNAALHIVCVLPLAVHPRMRGERCRCSPNILPLRGSSPHARGTRTSFCIPRPSSRFIPACAGNAAPLVRPPSF